MLELYRVPDNVVLEQFISTQALGHDLEQIYLGGLELKEHMLLTKILPEVNSLPYFEDSYLKSVQVRALHEMIGALPDDKSSVLRKLQAMLVAAVQNNEAIIALCD